MALCRAPDQPAHADAKGAVPESGISPSEPVHVIRAFYFPPGDPDAVSISSSDLGRLAPGMFLSDELIDFYIK